MLQPNDLPLVCLPLELPPEEQAGRDVGTTEAARSYFETVLPQTPQEVARVIEVAGWTVREAARALDVHPEMLREAIREQRKLTDYTWRRLLDVAGKRSFDHDGDSVE